MIELIKLPKEELEQIKDLNEQLNGKINSLRAFPYVYETLTGFNVNANQQELVGILHSLAQIEQVYIDHLDQFQDLIIDNLIKLNNKNKG